ncbi:MAG: SpoIID/LytB domain-containing protein [Spirochaetaceae bacterium]|nr:MAG: SpoIID/LytB domain-containing protein [Spirochaetaceae bacterium]
MRSMPHVCSRLSLLLILVNLVVVPLPAYETHGVRQTDGRDDTPAPERAVEYYYQGRIEAAVEEFRQLVQRQPQDRGLRSDLALLLLEQGRHAEAIEQLSSVDDPLIGTALVLAGRPRQAIDALAAIEQPSAEQLFWRGVAEQDAGNLQHAREAFAGATRAQAHLPYAYHFLGQLALEQEDWPAAVEYFVRALRQDANLTSAFEPLARARMQQGEIDSAYALLGRAEIALPWDLRVQRTRTELERHYPHLREEREAEVAARRVIVSAPRVTALPERAEDAPGVRIGLAEDVDSLYLKTGGAWQLKTAYSPDPQADGERDDVLLVERLHPAGVRVSCDDGFELYRGVGPLELSYADTEATTVLFDLAYGHGQFSAGREDRSYRGALRVLSWPDRGFTVVNEVNLEAYLLSVVPSEMPAHWPSEALAAQAIAARSYTLAPRARFHARGFDLLGSVLSAFYRGVGGEHPRSTEAVHATIGQVLMEGETPLNAVYSANSAGYTESSASVWGFASALVGVSDKLLPRRDEAASPAELEAWLHQRPASHSNHERYSSYSAYRWSRWVSQEELTSRLGQSELGRITALITRGRGTSGRVERVEVVGTEGTTVVERDAIRSRLGGLRSNLFSVYPKLGPDGLPSYFVVTGAGWGHGVGMDQSGAAGMAAAGYTAAEILGHYYPKAELRRLY